MRRRVLVVVAAALLAGCAAPGGGSSSGSPASTAAPVDLEQAVLTIERVGGLVPENLRHEVPLLSMWTDGLIVQPGAQIEIYPPPALPAVMSSQVDPAAMPGVLATVSDGLAGLADDFGTPPTADVPATVVTWRSDEGAAQTWTAASLGVGDEEPAPGLTAEQILNREQLTRVVDYALAVAAGSVETVPVTDTGAFAPAAWAVWSAPYVPVGDQPQEPQKWPGPPLGEGCQVVTGPAATEVTAALTAANALTPWRSGGQRWSVTVRPMLPGEPTTSCPE